MYLLNLWNIFFTKKNIVQLFSILICASSVFSEIVFSTEKEVVDFAIKNSASLKEAKNFSIEQMKNAKISIDNFLPKLQFGWSEFDNINKNNLDNRAKSIECSITQPIFDNGKTQLEYKYKKYISLLSYYAFKNQLKNFCISVSEKYYQYILQCKIIDIKNQLLENMKQNLQIIEYEYNNGMALKSDLLEYQISYREIKNQITKENNTKQNIFIDLKNLLNIKQEFSITESTEPINYKNTLLKEKTELYENLIIKNDIELKQKKATQDFQIAQNKISNQFYIPSISLQSGISFSGISYPLTQPSYSFNIVFSFNNIPFVPSNFSNAENIKTKKLNSITNSFSSNIIPQVQYFSNKRLTKISLNQSLIEYNQTIEQLKKEIIQYIQENDNSLEYINLLTESIKLKEEKFKISEYQVKNGLMSTSDFLKEKINLSEAKQTLIREQIALLILQSKINILIGDNKI